VIELERQRDAGALLRDSLGVYLGHFWTFLALGALVVVPSELIVNGVGLNQLTGGYDSSVTFADTAIPAVVSYLVVAPLITAICVYALQSVAAGGSTGAREAIVKGFEQFSPIFFAVLLAALGILLGAVLILPGLYLFVRWYFVPQAVVLENTHGAAALRSSARIVKGFWWRTFGLIVLVNVLALIVVIILGSPFTAAADRADRAVWALVGEIIASSVVQPFGALYSTLLYFDLRARQTSVQL
jgi:Membrane domain of glycerophosphoryl diester phosphodiesterase